MDEQRKFIEAVLPEEGLYCVLGVKGKSREQHFASTIDEFLALTKKLVDRQYETYFGTAKYESREGGRFAENAKWFKCFRLDLDCGDSKPYKTQAEALSALDRFISRTELPQPTILNSGRGVHVYWPLTYTIIPSDWKKTADLLRILCSEQGLHTDTTCTTDAARVLRLPGTLNFKEQPPKPVQVINNAEPSGYDYLHAVIEGKCINKPGANALGFEVPKYVEMDDTTRSLLGNNVSNFNVIMRKSIKGEGCEQLLHIYKNQNDVDYNLWRAGLSIAINCEDGKEAIHKLSYKHKEYNPEETENIARSCLDKPHKCSTFESMYSQGCNGCSYKGKITSPIQIGAHVAEAAPEDNVVTMKNEALQEELTVQIPKFPFPYFRGKNGGVYRRGDKNPDTGEMEEILIHEYDFYVVKRMQDPDKGECVLMRLHLPKDGMREFVCPLTTMTAPDRYSTFLAQHGLLARDKKLVGIMNYTSNWVSELQRSVEAEQARQQFGWHENDTKFIIGNREVTGDGVNYSPPSASTIDIAGGYNKKGNIREWTKLANIYNHEGNEPRAFTLFAGFGSALFKFTGLDGAIIHLVNNGSGVGKTTLQEMVLSVWGNPKETMVHAKDSSAARISRASKLGNVALCIDEVSNLPGEDVSNMTFAISQGRDRNRMQAQINAERTNNLRWSLIAITSGNNSLYDRLYGMKDYPEGELMRILELTISKTDSLTKEETDKMFKPMYQNYGIAGEIFIEYVINNLDEVKTLIESIQVKLDRAAGLTQRERFWSATVACSLAGGMIAYRLGLHNIDPKKIYKWAVDMLSSHRQEVKSPQSSTDALSAIGQYINECTNNILIINSAVDSRSGVFMAPVKEPHGELKVRYEPDTKMIFLVSKAFRDWCSKNQIHTRDLRNKLTELGVFETEAKKVVTKGTGLHAGSVWTWPILLKDEFSSELGMDINELAKKEGEEVKDVKK